MLKKITNWTFGSVFRTIGRFLAYFLIGIIIALFFVKKDYVKADTYVKGVDTPWKNNTGTVLPKNGPYHYINKLSGTTVNSGFEVSEFYLQNNEQVDITSVKGGTVEIPFYVSATNINDGDHTQYTCGEWKINNIGYQCNYWMTDNGYTNVLMPTVNVWTMLVYNNGYTDMCTIDLANNKIRCPIAQLPTNNKIWFIQVRTQVYYGENIPSQGYTVGLGDKVNLFKNDFIGLQENENNNHQESMNYFNSTISGEINGTGENGTITDADAESSSCGIICKLKHLIKMLSIDNIKYLVVPTEEQMNDLFNQMQTKITSKLGILGLPVTVYTRLMQIAMQYQDGTNNWCISWNAVQVPNFEDYNIIQAGQYCFSDMLQNEKINTFRNTCHMIIGGLILLSFIQYLFNCLHRILDVPVQDNYEYFTTEDVYGIDTTTGEVQSHQIKSRTTTRRPL